MLGDSFTEGAGLRLDETVAKRIEAALNRGQCVGRYEVIELPREAVTKLLGHRMKLGATERAV